MFFFSDFFGIVVFGRKRDSACSALEDFYERFGIVNFGRKRDSVCSALENLNKRFAVVNFGRERFGIFCFKRFIMFGTQA